VYAKVWENIFNIGNYQAPAVKHISIIDIVSYVLRKSTKRPDDGSLV